MTKKARNWSIAIGIVAFPFILFLGFLIFMDAEPLPPIAPLPQTNGYDDFRKAEEMLASSKSDYTEMDETRLRTFVAGNAVALQTAREGLEKQCAVPLQFTEAYNSNHLSDLSGIKQLAQAFVAEGKLAEMGNHPADAAESYLDAFHLGSESMRGGVLIDGLVGIAVETMAANRLTNLVARLDAKSCSKTATALEAFDSQNPAWNEIMQQEHAWSLRTFRGIRYDYARFRIRKTTAMMFKKAEKKFETHEQETRKLIIDFAARAYKLDKKGKPPVSVSDLVPDYLQAVPQDPFTKTNMDYLPKNNASQ